MRHTASHYIVAGVAWLLVAGLCLVAGQEQRERGAWGIDACLTTHVNEQVRAAYLERLTGSNIGWLRERQPEGSMAGLREAGYRVVAFTSFGGLKPQDSMNQLAEDLRVVFAIAKTRQEEIGKAVSAWEMVGEPDLGFCRDLPDRVAAYQKALYLGLKAGAAEAARKPETGNLKPEGSDNNSGLRSQVSGLARAPLVLMGALGGSPGPWLERAARNGLLDYTDAYNFHFYGRAEDLTDEIKAHRAFAARWNRRGVPLWITECGLNAVKPGDFLNAARRQMQAAFTVFTARQALKAKDVAVFMPFILVHDGDPYAMTLAADKPLPAWTAYAEFANKNPWPNRTLATPPVDPNPLIVQWLPDNRTTTPHKVSGTYRFKEGQPIKGELRIYNFSDKPTRGRLEHGAESRELGVRINMDNASIEISAMGMVSIPLEFTARTSDYFQEEWAAQFVDAAGRPSPVSFGLEQPLRTRDFIAQPLALSPLPNGRIQYPLNQDYKVTSQGGPWTGINGLKVSAEARGQTSDGSRQSSDSVTAWIEKVEDDPLYPPMAVARVAGLPGTGFLRMQLERPMSRSEKVRVDLVDEQGRRFTIWENFGVSYYDNNADVWLNMADFHNYSWGKTTNDPAFHPERVREVQLRFYLTKPNEPMSVKLSFMKAKRMEQEAGSKTK